MRDNHHRVSLSEVVHRMWRRWQGERLLVVVLCLWIEDYQHGKVYQVDGQLYRITRYVHAVNYDFHEVWGCEVDGDLARVAMTSVCASE